MGDHHAAGREPGSDGRQGSGGAIDVIVEQGWDEGRMHRRSCSWRVAASLPPRHCQCGTRRRSATYGTGFEGWLVICVPAVSDPRDASPQAAFGRRARGRLATGLRAALAARFAFGAWSGRGSSFSSFRSCHGGSSLFSSSSSCFTRTNGQYLSIQNGNVDLTLIS